MYVFPLKKFTTNTKLPTGTVSYEKDFLIMFYKFDSSVY